MTPEVRTAFDLRKGPPPPGGPTPPPTRREVRRARLAVAAIVAGGLAVDLGLRGGGIGLGSTVALSVAALGVLATGRHRTAETWGLTAVALVLAGCLAVRTSPWIVILDWIAVVGLLALAATPRAGIPVIGQSLVSLARRATMPWVMAPATGVIEPIEIGQVLARDRRDRRHRRATDATGGPMPDRPRPSRTGLAPAVARGLLLAVPIVAGLGLLLGSADAVFASFFEIPTPRLDLGGALVHLLLVGLGAAVVAALLGTDKQVRPLARSTARPLGAIEATVVLIGLALLYTLFAVAQLVAAVGGDGRVQSTTGLTYAEYARSGFFQLLWAAGITLVVLLGIRALTRETSPRQDLAVRACSALCCLLTLVLVAAAINRLAVYRNAYGLTMLRLACTTFAWFLGATFVLLAVRLVQGRGGRDWLPTAMAVTALLTLLWWNGSNPEAHVARTNIDRAVETGKLDADYADGMSDDALPTLVAGLDRLPADARADLVARLCGPEDPEEYDVDWGRPHVEPEADGTVETNDGWAAFSWGRRAAVDAIEDCPAR
ncbi:MAG TPA: DUF4173 domain-containing protein [Iamia sp.]|nr:DUF4173 domain-containing protein [Iamia sp.]